MSRVKVLYAIDRLVRSGTELQLLGLIDRLDRTRYEPYLLTIRDTDEGMRPADCPHLAWSVPRLASLSALAAVRRLARLIRDEGISVVHTFFQDATVVAGLAGRLAGAPVRIASFRDMGFWWTRPRLAVMRRVYAQMNGFVSNAEMVRDHFSEALAIEKAAIQVIRNGIDVDALSFRQHDEVRHVVFVGNMTRAVKRADLFIKAAGIVSRLHPDITWHLVGDGHLRGDLAALARTWNVADRVRFVGRIDDVATYLEGMQVGVICSDSEGLSNAILEYMCKGVAVVATDVGGNPELVRHGQTGLLVPPDDPEALAEALLAFIANGHIRHRMATAARRHVEGEYSWSTALAAHDELYTRLLERSGEGRSASRRGDKRTGWRRSSEARS